MEVLNTAKPGVALAKQLATVSRIIRDQFDSRLAESNATVPTWIILSSLAEKDDISQRQLALLSHMEEPAVTKHLERLTGAGIVCRQRDRRDRRIVRVRLTPEGRRYYFSVSRIVNELAAGVEALLAPEERAQLAALLGQFLNGLAPTPVPA